MASLQSRALMSGPAALSWRTTGCGSKQHVLGVGAGARLVEWDTGGGMQETLRVCKTGHAWLKWGGRASAQRVRRADCTL